ncbi:hypothetical protein N2152v2_001359 [Parachlorella kessleri]
MATAGAAAASPAAAGTAVDGKLVKLRHAMASFQTPHGKGLDAFIVPSEDPHMSEYPPENFARRAFISNFDGSAGTVVVTADKAALWTDGRYFLQAEQQLGPGWTLMRQGTPSCPEIPDWLVSTLPEGGKVGIDPFLHTIESAEKLHRHLAARGKHLVPLPVNLVDAVWATERPAAPQGALRVHSLEWAGRSVADKLEDLRKEMQGADAGALLVTMLDEVAWLLNLRGADVAYNPVFVSYVIVTPSGATLYIDEPKVTAEIEAHLKEAGVDVRPYDTVLRDVESLAHQGTKIWMDPTRVSYAIKQAAIRGAQVRQPKGKNGTPVSPGRKRTRRESAGANGASPPAAGSESATPAALAAEVILSKTSPVVMAKAVKNEAELAGMREAHLRDGVALVGFLCWLDKTIAGGTVLTEVQIDEELTARRRAQPGFVELSFPTIAGAGPNGAIIHYRAQPGSCRSVDASTLLLLDSGCQYDCGTTDITRTMHFGEPSQHQRLCYTRVLQGHIGIDTAVWPEGTPGCALDTLARVPLWSMGLNYRHGTGHGVGAALNVHEGPQSISSRFWNTQPLLGAMVCSNEPGYYEDGAFGIRIENLFVVKEADTAFRYGGESYYTCERLTMCPIQKKMIAREVLSEKEVAWVDGYHRQVWEALSPRLSGAELEWLREATSALQARMSVDVVAELPTGSALVDNDSLPKSKPPEPPTWPQLEDLPPPVLAHIASFVERPRDVASLAACCRALQSQSSSWWQRLDLHLRSDHQAALLSHWLDGTHPDIHSLHLEATRTGLLEVAFGLPSPRLPALKDLTLKGGILYDARLMDSTQQQTQLTSLAVRMVGSLAGVQVAAPASMLKLRSLSLSGFRRLGLSSNRQLSAGLDYLDGLGKLTSLYLSKCGIGMLPPAVRTLTALQRLDAAGNRSLAAGLEHLAGLSRLSSLRLGGCALTELPPAFSTLTALRKLELNGNARLAQGLQHLAGLPYLGSIERAGCGSAVAVSCSQVV